jgi:hypothetical protein
MPEYLDCFVDLAPAIKKFLEMVRVLVSPFEGEKRIRQRIEGALAAHIKNQEAPASSLLPKDV